MGGYLINLFWRGGFRRQRCWLPWTVPSVFKDWNQAQFCPNLWDQIRGCEVFARLLWILLRLSKLSSLEHLQLRLLLAMPSPFTTTTTTMLLQGMLIHNPLHSNNCYGCGEQQSVVLLSSHSYAPIASCRQAAWLTGGSSPDPNLHPELQSYNLPFIS